MPDITGPAVTLDGTAIQGALITVIHTDTGAVLGETTTDASGNWTITVDAGQTVHVLAEYEDSEGTLYQEHSHPFVTVESTGPVGTPTHWWPHDTGSGTTLYDNAGTADSQTWVGSVWQSGDGYGGYHVWHDGTDDYIRFGTNFPIPNTNGAMSQTMWFRPERFADQEVMFGDYNDFWLAKEDDDSVVASYNNRSVDVPVIPAGTLTSEWYFIAATRDEAGNISTYYNDNGLQNTAVHDHVDQGEQHAIGANAGNNNFYQGATDDLRLYDYELTAQDVLDIYTNTSANYTGH